MQCLAVRSGENGREGKDRVVKKGLETREGKKTRIKANRLGVGK